KEAQEWTLPKASLILKRAMKGFVSELTLTPREGKGSLILGLAHQLGSSRFDVTANFNHISFKNLISKNKFSLSPLRPETISPDDILNFLQSWDIPVNGNVHLALIPTTLQVIEGTCRVNIGKGNL